MNAWLQIRGLTKFYSRKTILDSIDLDINKGELFVFLGPSGAGKSTILNCISGMIFPDGGSITREGVDITRLPANKRNIGMVFQNYSLFPNMTVQQNVEFPLQAKIRHGLLDMIQWGFETQYGSRFKEKIDEALSLVKLIDHAGKKPEHLSGGEQQRVALARALVFDPELLCLDEPLGSLDKNLRYEMQFEIRAIQKRLNKTLLYVTHDQSEAFSISDRIAIINNGHIEQIGTPRELYESPANEFVALFLGECNTFEIQNIDKTGKEYALTTSKGSKFFSVNAPKTDSHVVAIRPESFTVTKKKPLNSTYVKGKLANQTFIGSQIRMEIELESTDRIITVISSGDITENVSNGEMIYANYKPEACLILPGTDRQPHTKPNKRR